MNVNTFSFGRESFSSIIHPLDSAQQTLPAESATINEDPEKKISMTKPIQKTLYKSSSTKL
jgi:hypothetical protein